MTECAVAGARAARDGAALAEPAVAADGRCQCAVLSADGGARFLGGPFLDPKSADLVLFLAAFKIIFKSI